jgi:L-seryl-tRNA(Ser) seleniumtransferase
VDRLVQAVVAADLHRGLPASMLVGYAREALTTARRAIGQGESVEPDALVREVARLAARDAVARLRHVVNGTGVVVQTNLGRAPLSAAALQAIASVAGGYSNLEYDLDRGERGSRYDHLTATLAILTGAEAALAVNNNAAAVLLVLSGLCAGREVIVSRGQAVEIGGGFRIPDVLRQSGATLVEVGTTNRTYARDYAEAITDRTAAMLTVHRSNFRVTGFTHDPADAELAALARERGILWIDDWGSGSLLQTADYGLAHEPTVSDRVQSGCDIVCFSGDKLLGGPQAGLIVGRADLLGVLRSHPLTRALRVDKLVIAAMEATLRAYVYGTAADELPVWRMIGVSPDALHARAARVVELLPNGVEAMVLPCESAVGGGSMPGETLPSYAVALRVLNPDAFHGALRAGHPAVVGRIADGLLRFDLRTILPDDDATLAAQIGAAYAALHNDGAMVAREASV